MMNQQAASLLPNTSIVELLKKRGELPIEFLARLLGRKSDDIRPQVVQLQNEGVIESHGDVLTLRQQK